MLAGKMPVLEVQQRRRLLAAIAAAMRHITDACAAAVIPPTAGAVGFACCRRRALRWLQGASATVAAAVPGWPLPPPGEVL